MLYTIYILSLCKLVFLLGISLVTSIEWLASSGSMVPFAFADASKEFMFEYVFLAARW